MASTYEPIATTTLSSAQSSVTFSSISGSYTDLILIVSGTSATSQQIALEFNGDTGSNYSMTALYGDGSSAASARATSTTTMYGGLGWFGTSTTTSTTIAHIMNYSNTTTYKTVVGRGNLSSSYVHAGVGLWRSTAAITSIKITVNGGYNWNSGTSFTLYGIKAA
jgi:hypothetical protein